MRRFLVAPAQLPDGDRRSNPWPISVPASRATLGALLSCAALLVACGTGEQVRPNLVLLTVDGLRPDLLDCYGGDQRLGAEVCDIGETGSRYVWAFSASPSGPPAAASILTSQYPSVHGAMASASTFLRRDAITVAEVLRSGGYATAAFISSPELNHSRNFHQGFDLFDDRASSPNHRDAASLSEPALAWIKSARRPFFLWIHYSDPHGPFDAQDSAASEAGESPSVGDSRRAYVTAYEDSIRRLDRKLSQLIALLGADNGELGILLTALHGQALGEHEGHYGHGGSVALEEIRVPMLWRMPRAGPGRGVGRRITTPVSTLDVAPTLVAAAGLPRPDSFQGEPLPFRDASSDPGATPREIFAEHADEVAVIVDHEYASARRSANAAMLSTGAAMNGTAPERAGPRSGDRTASLWKPGERTSEATPGYDSGAARIQRWQALEPRLERMRPRLAPGVTFSATAGDLEAADEIPASPAD